MEQNQADVRWDSTGWHYAGYISLSNPKGSLEVLAAYSRKRGREPQDTDEIRVFTDNATIITTYGAIQRRVAA